jgi:hypothetical protein
MKERRRKEFNWDRKYEGNNESKKQLNKTQHVWQARIEQQTLTN